MSEKHLIWNENAEFRGCFDALIGSFERQDGVRFSYQHMPTNHIRGPYRLLIETADDGQFKWPSLSGEGVSMRYFHSLENLKSEAELIASQLILHRVFI